MDALAWGIMIVVFMYTAGFAFKLWQNKNKAGSIAVLILALAIAVMPFFSVLNSG
ncbi:hypothetical protein [Cytobacillus firmus]|uniref:hypothetical protein n=1 Tax=Cytobacillus firmus TaxID=1399 RepID=UPI0021617A56|nr:hypothetical protein [Cytobacillus firmus]MCS0669944.1 hypothetical protein [Cytobacillus firmus]